MHTEVQTVDKELSDVTNRIVTMTNKIEAELELLSIEDHASVVEILRVYAQRRAVEVAKQAQRQNQLASAIRSGQHGPHVVTAKA
jgi:DNA transposition AAA+ family ATPase